MFCVQIYLKYRLASNTVTIRIDPESDNGSIVTHTLPYFALARPLPRSKLRQDELDPLHDWHRLHDPLITA